MRKIYLVLTLPVITLNIMGQELLNNLSFNIFFQPNLVYRFDKEFLPNNDKPKYGYQAGVGMTYGLNKKIGFSSGISFYKKGYNHNQKFNQTNPPDPLVPEELDISNNYYFLGVPITLNYKMFDFDKFIIYLNTGVCGNIFLYSKEIYEKTMEDNIDKWTETFHGNSLTRYLNLSGLICFDFDYSFSDKVSLMIKPNYEVMILPFLKNTDLLLTRFWDLGIRFGLNYKL